MRTPTGGSADPVRRSGPDRAWATLGQHPIRKQPCMSNEANDSHAA